MLRNDWHYMTEIANSSQHKKEKHLEKVQNITLFTQKRFSQQKSAVPQ